MAMMYNQDFTAGKPMPGYRADSSAQPIAFDQTTANNYMAMNGGRQATVVNPNLWNSQNMPTTQWSNPGGSAPAGGSGAGSAGGGSSPSGAVTGAMSGNLQGILDQINKSFDLQNNAATQQAGTDWQKAMASRGLGRADMASQSMNAEILGKALNPLAIGRSDAITRAMIAQQNADQGERQFQQNFQLRQQEFQADQARQARQDQWAQEDRARQQQFQPMQDQLTQQALQERLSGQPLSGGGGSSPSYYELQAAANEANAANQSQAERFMAGFAKPSGAVSGVMGGGGGGGGGGLPGFGTGLPTIGTGVGSGLDGDGNWLKPGSYSRNTGANRTGTWTPPGAPPLNAGSGGGAPAGYNTNPSRITR